MLLTLTTILLLALRLCPTKALGGSRAQICVINPLRDGRFDTRAVNPATLGFFLQHGHLNGTCNSQCGALCDDSDPCTIDDTGSCEEDGCPASPRRSVDCGIGFVCDDTLGCIPAATGVPSTMPSSLPTAAPSSPKPSSAPSLSTEPSLGPSIFPSAEPSSQAPSDPPSAEPSSQAPSDPPPSSRPSMSPTSAPTNQRASAASDSRTQCIDNLVVYNLDVDLQVDFPGNAFMRCSSAQWNQIQTTISNTLDWEFKTVVPDWEGDVSFGTVAMDADQEVYNLGSRSLRGTQEQQWQQQHRQLSACPSKRYIPCDGGYCYWGCVFAPATSCGVNSLANWAGLAEGIQVALVDLDYQCLGAAGGGLVVNLVVGEGPEATPTD